MGEQTTLQPYEFYKCLDVLIVMEALVFVRFLTVCPRGFFDDEKT